MMDVFGDYSTYYDLLYENKDYEKECQFLERIFRKYSSVKIETILDLGCGTGSHGLILAKGGYKVTGVDFSKNMLKVAREKAKKEEATIDFHHSDIKVLRLNKKFDAIIAMFNLMGYQTTNDDIEKAILTARRHLKKEGLFIFDVWFGPAVLHNKPRSRKKVIEKGGERIVRETRCRMNLISQVVEVHFKIKRYQNRKIIEAFEETHPIRFFFSQELYLFMERNGFEIIRILPFMEEKNIPNENTWNITCIFKAK